MHSDHEKSNLKHFEQLFKMHFKALKIYSMRYVFNDHIAEDIVQDAFFDLWNRQDKIELGEHVKSYLFKSVYHKSLNYLRDKKTNMTIEPANDYILLDSYLQAMQNQEEYLIVEEIQQEITKVIDQLPPQCKKVFILSRTFELKNREIAEKLDISIKSVEKHITKALAIMHEHLKKISLFMFMLIIHLLTK